AKYGFAITAHLLNVLGEVATGYDIGCKFGKMVRMHPVLSPLASANNYKSLVGAFHGHAHCRRCQLKNLTTYVEGGGAGGPRGMRVLLLQIERPRLKNTILHRVSSPTSYHHIPQACRYGGRLPQPL
ncbi:hypothetical protein B0H14DRAFT_2378049, partial [Mycena olivaceomarginata]